MGELVSFRFGDGQNQVTTFVGIYNKCFQKYMYTTRKTAIAKLYGGH